jgi:tetratricopeptide (TPR) repeat protein
METHRLILMIMMASAVPAVPRAIADEKSWTGESVLPTKPPKVIKFGDVVDGKEVSFPFSGFMPIKVRDDRDGWLRIHDGRREGWVNKADFVLARDAQDYFHRLVQANPKDTWALYMRGNVWKSKGELDIAIKDFDQCIGLEPTNSAAFNARGNAWQDKKKYDNAIKDYDEAIRLDPKSAPLFNNRGTAWHKKKEYDKAIKDYDEAIRLDATDVVPFIDRGNAWQDKKEYDKAIKDYEDAILLDPKNCWAHFGRSVARMLMRSEVVADGFQGVLRLEGWKGDLAPYAVIVGHLAARQRQDEEAAKRFLSDSVGKLHQAWPNPAIEFLRGNIDEPALLKLATDDDKRTEARCFLGMDHALKGRRDEALAHFRWVKEHGYAGSIEYTIAVAELERLEKSPKGLKR